MSIRNWSRLGKLAAVECIAFLVASGNVPCPHSTIPGDEKGPIQARRLPTKTTTSPTATPSLKAPFDARRVRL